MTTRHVEILLVEDNEADAGLAEIAFRRAAPQARVQAVSNAKAALDHLNRVVEAGEEPPALILMDLNLPGTTGLELLAEIRAIDTLRTIPVVVLTSSENPREVRRCYEAGANAVVSKPVDFGRFEVIVQALVAFWLEAATLPGR